MNAKTVVLCLNQKKVIVVCFAHMGRCLARPFKKMQTVVSLSGTENLALLSPTIYLIIALKRVKARAFV